MLKKVDSKMLKPEIWETVAPTTQLLGRLIKEYKNKVNWRADGRDSVIEVGCAGGRHTINFLRPILPKNFDRLIGVDISPDMIAHAQKTYAQPKIEFKTFDIVDGDTCELPQVDHIVSFFVFHLLHNHEKAATNIYNLVKPGGDCFLAHLRYFPYFTAYELIARDPKWSKYITNLLTKCGFSRVEVSSFDWSFEIGDFNVLQGLVRTVPALYKGIPLAEHDEYTDDFAQHTIDAFNLYSYNKRSDRSKVYIPGASLIAYARK